MGVTFPISIKFEDGTTEEYKSIEELQCNLEDFDSDLDTSCEVQDSSGRPVRLKLKLLEVKELSIIETK
jgi:hypothetical protein